MFYTTLLLRKRTFVWFSFLQTRLSFTFQSVYQAILDIKDDLFIIRLNVQNTGFLMTMLICRLYFQTCVTQQYGLCKIWLNTHKAGILGKRLFSNL